MTTFEDWLLHWPNGANLGDSQLLQLFGSVVGLFFEQALLLGEPGIFFTTPGYDGWPLVMVRLAEVDVERLTELVTDAWRMRAPAALADELGEAAGVPGVGRG